jgi:hypothetical protein
LAFLGSTFSDHALVLGGAGGSPGFGAAGLAGVAAVSGQSGSSLPALQSSAVVRPARAWAADMGEASATSAKAVVSLRIEFAYLHGLSAAHSQSRMPACGFARGRNYRLKAWLISK